MERQAFSGIVSYELILALWHPMWCFSENYLCASEKKASL